MGAGLIGIGISGINAAEAEIATASSNIANDSNPNYSAESVALSTLVNGLDGAGAGVQVDAVQRSSVPFLSADINQATASQSYYASFTQALQVAQTYLEPSSGSDLSDLLQNLFNAFTNLSSSPQDPSLRNALLNAASSFASAAQQLSLNLGQTVNNVLSPLNDLVTQVNSTSAQIAALNSQIASLQASGSPAAALQDERDALENQLAALVGATADANGDVAVGGVPLVSGTQALKLIVAGSGTGVELEVSLPQGDIPIPSNELKGQIGGILAGAASVSQLRTTVDSWVVSVAQAINSQYAKGYGLDGSTGNTLFLIPGGSGPIELNPAANVNNVPAASSAAGLPGDGSNAAALAALAQLDGIDPSQPSQTASQAFSSIATDFGASIQNATQSQQEAQASLTSLTQLKQSVTGVSLNDQLANLVEYQNALEAAGRAVQVATDVVSFLLANL